MKKTIITAEPGKQELFINREFDAPRELVFKAFTDPKLLIQWLNPCNLTMKIEKMESIAGGSYRYIHTDTEGREFGFHGVYHEIAAPERLIRTFEFEGLPEKGHAVLEILRLQSLPGNRTKLTIQSVFQSVTDRDGMVASGMEYGVSEAHNLLDGLLLRTRTIPLPVAP
jgi:uncharacterized protein YndB with AHSA1/START domain